MDTNKTALERLKQRRDELNQVADYPNFVAKCFAHFVRFNTRLQHLDLSHTGLSEQILVAMMPGLVRSKSMLSMHLNFNPGITPQLTSFYETQLKCKPQEERVRIKVGKYTRAEFARPAYEVAEDLGCAVAEVEQIKAQHERMESTEALSMSTVKSNQKYRTY